MGHRTGETQFFRARFFYQRSHVICNGWVWYCHTCHSLSLSLSLSSHWLPSFLSVPSVPLTLPVNTSAGKRPESRKERSPGWMVAWTIPDSLSSRSLNSWWINGHVYVSLQVTSLPTDQVCPLRWTFLRAFFSPSLCYSERMPSRTQSQVRPLMYAAVNRAKSLVTRTLVLL